MKLRRNKNVKSLNHEWWQIVFESLFSCSSSGFFIACGLVFTDDTMLLTNHVPDFSFTTDALKSYLLFFFFTESLQTAHVVNFCFRLKNDWKLSRPLFKGLSKFNPTELPSCNFYMHPSLTHLKHTNCMSAGEGIFVYNSGVLEQDAYNSGSIVGLKGWTGATLHYSNNAQIKYIPVHAVEVMTPVHSDYLSDIQPELLNNCGNV